jgi:hypothetical protein
MQFCLDLYDVFCYLLPSKENIMSNIQDANTITVARVKIDYDDILNPAVNGWEMADREVYFVRGEEIVGIGITYGGVDHRVDVLPHDDVAKALFADDYIWNLLGRHGGFTYSAHTGQPMMKFTDEDIARYKGTYVVSKFMHDAGMLPRRYTVTPTSQACLESYQARLDRTYAWKKREAD